MTNGVLSFAGRLPDKNGSAGAAGPGESREARAAGGFVRSHADPADYGVCLAYFQSKIRIADDTREAAHIAITY
ncbi:hypothetical protein [Succinimonas sp.]|uniref:hypothetical protein n=1 Tax=Succinimonas sp. TaxID=1936151 RepID=UPI003863639E